MGQIDRTAFTALVDDDGSNTTGTIWNKTQIQSVILDPVDNALGQTQTTTVTGAQNNFALSTGARLLRVNNASDVTFSGFSAGVDDQVLIVKAIGAGNVFIKHLSGLSSAANQCANMATVGDTPLSANGTALYVYDGTSSQWRLVAHDQGGWITPTFSAGDFTGASPLTWTVAGGSVNTMQYYLRGKTLTVGVSITLTSTGGTAAGSLQIANTQWGSFTVKTRLLRIGARTVDAATGTAGYICVDNTANTKVLFVRDSALANWSNAAASNTSVEGEISFEVN